jgi:hypothetical protein
MTLSLLLTCLLGYLGFAAVFVFVTQGVPRRARWAGLVAIAASAGFFFWAGIFSEQFDAGQCYSNVVDKIANAVEHTHSTGLAGQIRALPMHGYETPCQEVEVNQLPGLAP